MLIQNVQDYETHSTRAAKAIEAMYGIYRKFHWIFKPPTNFYDCNQQQKANKKHHVSGISVIVREKNIDIVLPSFYYENCFFLPVFWILIKILFFPILTAAASPPPLPPPQLSLTLTLLYTHNPHFCFHFVIYSFLLTSHMSDFYPQNSPKIDIF